MCAFLYCAAGVLHDSVSETQSQREAREEAREQSERAPAPSPRATRSEEHYGVHKQLLLRLF